MTVSVTDQKGQVVAGLPKDQFTVLDKKTPLQITSFSNEDQPTSIAILLDMSGSMATSLPYTAAWISRFIQGAGHSNEYLILGFDVQGRVLCNWGCSQRELVAALDSIAKTKAWGQTALYGSCAFALREVTSRKLFKRAIVLLSDGQDSMSKISYGELRRQLQQSDVMIYCVGLLFGGDVGSALGMEGQGILDDLALRSGGQAFYPKTRNEFDSIADHIAFELQHQYILGFKIDVTQNQHHEFKVKITSSKNSAQKHLTVRHRTTINVS